MKLFIGVFAISLASMAVGQRLRLVNPRHRGPVNFRPAIILGEPAQEGEIPFQAYLFSAANGSTAVFDCGGSLIRPNWILTAAHCLEDTDGTQVNLGSTNVNTMPYSEWSYHRIMHEDYDPVAVTNDVALIKLPVEATGQNIAVVEMADASLQSLVDQVLRASGFGLTATDGSTSEDLLKVDVQGISNAECESWFGPIPESNICTNWLNQLGEGTCGGDSGGPLSFNNGGTDVLIGVTSFGADNCEMGAPSVFARVSSFRDWVERTIANN